MKFSTDAGRTAPQCRIDRLTYFDVNSASTVETQDRVVERIDRLLTVEDLAGHLGVPVATIYAWRYHHQGPPGFRVGKHLRYRRTTFTRGLITNSGKPMLGVSRLRTNEESSGVRVVTIR